MCGGMFPSVCLRSVCVEAFEVFQEHKLVINEHH